MNDLRKVFTGEELKKLDSYFEFKKWIYANNEQASYESMRYRAVYDVLTYHSSEDKISIEFEKLMKKNRAWSADTCWKLVNSSEYWEKKKEIEGKYGIEL